jgi:filamentous hemagglutinin
VTANAQPSQTLVNEGGKLNANQLDLKVSNLANTHGGEIVQTGTGATRIDDLGRHRQQRRHLASNGSLAFVAASLNNKGGTLRAAQTSDLAVTVTGLRTTDQGEMSAGGNTDAPGGQPRQPMLDASRLQAMYRAPRAAPPATRAAPSPRTATRPSTPGAWTTQAAPSPR